MHARTMHRARSCDSRSVAASPSSVVAVVVPRSSTTSSMLSFFSKHKRKANTPHLGVDALPATATAVQEVEASSVSRRFAVEDATGVQGRLPPGNTLVLRSAVCYLPHPDKVYYGGEDAYFVSDVGGGAMGVADGVGGWQESGVNPADYSRMFMKIACAYLEGKDMFTDDSADRQPGALIDPRGALNAAHENTKVPGSATACVIQLDAAAGTLEAANLGDSGFVVLRNGSVVARSKPLQHYFDCPLQFGAFPEYVEATDTADMADTYSIPLMPGDVIVAGSDGLWDNTFDSEIIAAAPRTPEEVQRAADRIAATARGHAADNDFQSPYVREALSQGLDLPWWEKLVGASFKNGKFQLKQLSGGKMDDITVIVALVDAKDLPPQPPAEVPAPAAALESVEEGASGSDGPTAAVEVPQAAPVEPASKQVVDVTTGQAPDSTTNTA